MGTTAMTPGSLEETRHYHRTAEVTFAVIALWPAILLGTIPALVLRRKSRWLLLAAIVCGAVGVALIREGASNIGWPWLSLLQSLGQHRNPSPLLWGNVGAVVTEAAFGPALLFLWGKTGWPNGHTIALHQLPKIGKAVGHPANAVRLGICSAFSRFVDLTVSSLYRGLACFSVTGGGKSWAAARVAEGWLSSGGAVLTIDGKGGGLRDVMQRLAIGFRVKWTLFDPDRPDETSGYDLLTGTPSMVSNKLMSALVGSISGAAAIFGQINQGLLPLLFRVMIKCGIPLTFESIREFLEPGAMGALARKAQDAELARFAASAMSVRLRESAVVGMESRLQAVANGHYSPLWAPGKPMLSLEEATSEPGVTYFGLSPLSATSDTRLVFRCLEADLAALVSTRLDILQRGGDVVPLLVIADECSVLVKDDSEAESALCNLLLQCRAASVCLAIFGQSLPESKALRDAVLGTGTLLVLRATGTEDVEVLASALGSQLSTTVTHTTKNGWLDGAGTATATWEFKAHPEILRTLEPGVGYLRDSSGKVTYLRVLPPSLS